MIGGRTCQDEVDAEFGAHEEEGDAGVGEGSCWSEV